MSHILIGITWESGVKILEVWKFPSNHLGRRKGLCIYAWQYSSKKKVEGRELGISWRHLNKNYINPIIWDYRLQSVLTDYISKLGQSLSFLSLPPSLQSAHFFFQRLAISSVVQTIVLQCLKFSYTGHSLKTWSIFLSSLWSNAVFAMAHTSWHRW